MVNNIKKELKSILNALKKRAKGYKIFEVTEEFVDDNGSMRLSKRKVSKKDVPPDPTAAKLLLASSNSTGEQNYDSMTDEQLNKEKQRLFELFAKYDKQEVDDGVD